MEIGLYIDMIRKRLWLIALFLIMGVGGSLYYSRLQVPLYTATVTAAVNPSASVQPFPYLGVGTGDIFSLRDPLAGLVAGYRQYLRSRTFGALATQRLNLPMDPDSFGGLVSTSLVRDTNYLLFSVTMPDPREAQRIANGAVNLILQEVDDRASAGPMAEIRELAEYYRPKVEALRKERDRIENDPAMSSKDKMPLLGAVDARLAPLEELYLKLRMAGVEDASQMGPSPLNRLGGSGSSASEGIAVLEWAALPTAPESSGSTKNVLIAAVAALILGTGLAILLEYVDDRVRTPRHMERALGLAPLAVIGKIPDRRGSRVEGRGSRVGGQGSRVKGHSSNGAAYRSNGYDPKLIAALDPLDPAAEAFRRARTMILGRDPAYASQVLLVTSAKPGEGKSITLANLAVAVAQGEKRVVVVDADLRRPAQHRIFGVTNEAGLTAVLAGEGKVERWLQSTEIENLSILTAGRTGTSPANLLSSHRLRAALEELKGCADVVLVDSPALSAAADALILAPNVEGVLLVADAAATTSSALSEARASLERIGAVLRGIVLTKFTEKKDGYYYYGATNGKVSAPRLGEYLIKSNFLTADQLRTALKRQAEWAAKGQHKRIGEVLVELGFVGREDVEGAAATQGSGFRAQGPG